MGKYASRALFFCGLSALLLASSSRVAVRAFGGAPSVMPLCRSARWTAVDKQQPMRAATRSQARRGRGSARSPEYYTDDNDGAPSAPLSLTDSLMAANAFGYACQVESAFQARTKVAAALARGGMRRPASSLLSILWELPQVM